MSRRLALGARPLALATWAPAQPAPLTPSASTPRCRRSRSGAGRRAAQASTSRSRAASPHARPRRRSQWTETEADQTAMPTGGQRAALGRALHLVGGHPFAPRPASRWRRSRRSPTSPARGRRTAALVALGTPVPSRAYRSAARRGARPGAAGLAFDHLAGRRASASASRSGPWRMPTPDRLSRRALLDQVDAMSSPARRSFTSGSRPTTTTPVLRGSSAWTHGRRGTPATGSPSPAHRHRSARFRLRRPRHPGAAAGGVERRARHAARRRRTAALAQRSGPPPAAPRTPRSPPPIAAAALRDD